MKNTFLKSITGTALAVLVLVGGAHVSAFGQEEAKSDQTGEGRNHRRSIVVVWVVKITRRNCETGEPIGPASNVQFTFAKVGTLLETIGNIVFRSQGNGIWRRERGRNEYSYALRFMRFDAAGTFVGSGVVRADITLDATGENYTSTATNDILDANGNIISSGCATSVSTRFSTE
ncbi:MAG: hypothetical protein ACT4O9_07550 [Blastocatellia bacterium]